MKINELNKREKNSIIINFSMFLILFIIVLFYFIFSLIPQIKEIKIQKDETIKIYNEKNNIEKKGISFEEFKKLYNSSKNKTPYIDNIIETIDEDFFNKNLQNNENSINYITFIDNKTKDLNSPETQDIINSQKQKVSQLLPKYSENISDLPEGVFLSDFRFVNYVESILSTFNLQNSSPIGISKVSNVDEYTINQKIKGSGLDSNIYYISLNLNLLGTKSNILDFLYFVENVGKIEVEDNDIIINKNYSPLSKNGIKKVLKGDMFSPNYNIFENQIIDIAKLSFNEYIDSSYTSRGKNSLFDFLNATQANESIKADVELRFYVKGIPVYEIKESIDLVFSDLRVIKSDINKKLNNKDLRIIDNIDLSKYNETVKSLEKEFMEINKTKNNTEMLDKNYKRAMDIKSVLEQIKNNINNYEL